MTIRQRVTMSAFLLGIGACALSMSGEPSGRLSISPFGASSGPDPESDRPPARRNAA